MGETERGSRECCEVRAHAAAGDEPVALGVARGREGQGSSKDDEVPNKQRSWTVWTTERRLMLPSRPRLRRS